MGAHREHPLTDCPGQLKGNEPVSSYSDRREQIIRNTKPGDIYQDCKGRRIVARVEGNHVYWTRKPGGTETRIWFPYWAEWVMKPGTILIDNQERVPLEELVKLYLSEYENPSPDLALRAEYRNQLAQRVLGRDIDLSRRKEEMARLGGHVR
jgi:hypothetical protein